MHNLYFWKSWPSSYKYSFWALMILFVISLIGYFTVSYLGIGASIAWEVTPNLHTVDSVVEEFNLGLFQFQIPAKSYYIFQDFVPKNIDIPLSAVYSFMFLTVLGMLLLLAVVSCLNRFWFMIGIGLFSFLILNFQFDQLDFLGIYSKYSNWLVLLLFLIPTFYFHYLRPSLSLVNRLLVYLVVTLGLAGYIANFSQVTEPILYLANYGIYVSLILTLLFVVGLSSEVFVLFIKLLPSSSEAKKSKNTLHFFVLSAVYFLNLYLVYDHMTQNSSWVMVYLNAFTLFGIALVAGFFNWKHRIERFGGTFPFFPLGAFFYLGVSLVSLSTIIFFFLTANDPFLEVVEDTIVYSQLGFGAIFIVYVFVNFGTLLSGNKAVYKVLYKPTRMSILAYFSIGMALTFLLFMKSDWASVSQAKAGYYNSIADIYKNNGDTFTAQEYYKLAARHSYKNHRSYYSLSSLALDNGDTKTAIHALRNALGKNTSPFAYARLSELYREQGRFFDALFLLQEARKKYPENIQLLNNLGVLYSTTEFSDSSKFCFDQALVLNPSLDLIKSNQYALGIKNFSKLNSSNFDSLFLENSDVFNLNLLARANASSVKIGEEAQQKLLPVSTALSLEESLLLNNLNINTKGNKGLHKFLFSAVKDSSNFDREELLRFNYAISLYHVDSLYKCVDELEKLSLDFSDRTAIYQHTLGLITLNQNAPIKASEYFQKAVALNHPKANLDKLIADSESALAPDLLKRWEEFKISNTKLSADMQWLYLPKDRFDLENANDNQLYQLVRYGFRKYTIENQLGFTRLISDDYIRNMSLLLVAKHALDERVFLDFEKLTSQINFENDFIQNEKNKVLQEFYFVSSDFEKLGTTLGSQRGTSNRKHYALFLNKDGLVENQVTRQFQDLANKNPFDITVQVLCSKQLSKTGDGDGAYVTLQKALAYNPYSVELLEEFAKVALSVGLEDYATIAMADLKKLCSASRFKFIKENYENLRTKKTQL